MRASAFDPVAVASPTEQTLLSSEVKNLGTVLLDDPVPAVHSMPGVAANSDLYAQFSVRGAPYQRVGFYLDDIPMHAPFHTMQNPQHRHDRFHVAAVELVPVKIRRPQRRGGI